MGDKATCGDFGGRTKSGEPCGQPVASGRCRFHPVEGEGGDDELSDAERRFVEEYCVDFNGARAARAAGYSEDNAAQQASRLLRKAKVQEAKKERLAKCGMTSAEATARMADMARADLRHFTRIDDEGRLVVDLSSPQAQAMLHTIREIKQTEERDGKTGEVIELKTEIKLHDAKDALHKILQQHGAYTEKVDVTSKGESVNIPVMYLPDNGRVDRDE